MTTLWLEAGGGRETIKAIDGAMQLGYLIGRGTPQSGELNVPVGSVDFCEKFLGYSPKPDFYPEFLSKWFWRKITKSHSNGFPRNLTYSDKFVKSAEKYKAWPPKIIERYAEYPAGEIYISDVVEFGQEWRYYVADGCVLETGWYDGDDDLEVAPDLKIDWPKGFCGAVDFGRLANGVIALVECHMPFGCGWYGDDSAAYVMWLVEGWKYMLEQRNGRKDAKAE